MVKSEETVELVEKTVQRVLRKSNSDLSQILGSGIATTCKTLRQNLGDIIGLHPYMNILHHVMHTNLREWACVHHISQVLFSDTTAPKLLGCHSVQVIFQISCLLTIHLTTLS